MIIPGQHERHRRMGRLQIWVGAIQGMAQPVAGQIRRGRPDVPSGLALGRGGLIQVIAQMQHQVQVLVGEVLVGAVVAVLKVLAGHHGQGQPPGRRPGGGQGPGPADRAELPAGPEPVPPGAGRFQPLDLDVHGVGLGGLGEDGAAAHDPPEAWVGGDLPVDRHRPGRHPAIGQQRLGRQPGPQHHPARRRIARGHPEREGIPAPLRWGWPGPSQAIGDYQGGHGTARSQEAAAVQHAAGRCGHDNSLCAPRHASSPSSRPHSDRDPWPSTSSLTLA
jgi:hypothetical protein